jgi:hypothetical protein
MHLPTAGTSARLAVLGQRCLPDGCAEIRGDAAGTLPAVGVVVGATLLAALGGLLRARFGATLPSFFPVDIPRFFVHSVVAGSVVQVGMWFCAGR